MNHRYAQITLDVPSSLLHEISNKCVCSSLRENPSNLIIECVKYTARNANVLSPNEWHDYSDCYEDFVGSLDFETI